MMPGLTLTRLAPALSFPRTLQPGRQTSLGKTSTNVFKWRSKRLLPVGPVDFAPKGLETVLAPHSDEMGWVVRSEWLLLRSDEV